MNTFRSHPVRVSMIWCTLLLSLAGLAFGQARGDVNGDGLLNLFDAGLIKDHLLERSALQGGALTRADADGDGSLRTADIVYVINNMTVPSEITITLPGDVPLVMVSIPAGTFQMGSLNGAAGDPGWAGDMEAPQHQVTVPAFHMSKYEVTQQQWLALMSSWPGPGPTVSSGLGDNYPAYDVRWIDAVDFTDALNAHVATTGQGPATYRLPSEAEWEYACRAGSTTRFYFGDSTLGPTENNPGPPGDLGDYAWFRGNNSPSGCKAVGSKLPNAFGLYDMHGNIWEFCQDYYHDDYTGAPVDGSAWEVPWAWMRVVRGGVYTMAPGVCRSAARIYTFPGNRDFYIGIRLARTP